LRAPDFIRERAKNLRRVMTQPERILWFLLRRQNLHFRRQHPIGPYILDFYCAAAKLCVEVDGPVHDEQPERDQRRTAWLAKEGIRVLRFSAEDIQERSAAVLATIDSAAREARSAPSVGLPPPTA
jgi:very-short-patch-repair endonuclease